MRKSKTLSSNIIRKPKRNQQLRVKTFKDHNYTLFNLVKLSFTMACGVSGGRNNITNNQIVPFVYPMKPSLSLSHKILVAVSLITYFCFVFLVFVLFCFVFCFFFWFLFCFCFCFCFLFFVFFFFMCLYFVKKFYWKFPLFQFKKFQSTILQYFTHFTIFVSQ